MYGVKILCAISKVPFEISHKILSPYTAKYAFYEVLEIWGIMISYRFDILSLSETAPGLLLAVLLPACLAESHRDWGTPRMQCIMVAQEFPPFFKGHWQSPCTALKAGKLVLCKETVKQFRAIIGTPVWHVCTPRGTGKWHQKGTRLQ